MKFGIMTTACLVLACGFVPAQAEVKPSPLFAGGAVVQRSKATAIFGTAAPGETVTVALAGASAKAEAGPDGKWKVSLDLESKEAGPHEMTLQGSNTVTVANVRIGEVWICSGQSNMEMVLSKCIGAPEEIAASANPLLRHFLVKKSPSLEPKDAVGGSWKEAGPQASGDFTAIGYYFGKKLQAETGAPIGLVHASWGGSPCEAWISGEVLEADPGLKEGRAKSLEAVASYPEKVKAYPGLYREWEAKFNRQDRPTADPALFAGIGISTEGWKPLALPGEFSKVELGEAGAVWVRREVQLPAGAAGKDLALDLGLPRGFDTAYWNGEKVGQTTHEGPTGTRRYTVPAAAVKEGANVLSVRVFSPAGGGALLANWLPFKAGPVSLGGEWLAKREFTFPDDPAASGEYPKPPGNPPALEFAASALYNGMIHPLLPMTIKGVIWYQGETNAGRGWQYRTTFPSMIQDWRARWGQGDFPFYFCQLAGYGGKNNAPVGGGFAEVRDAQLAALAVPNTGMAVLIDVGETGDVHPRNKKDPGERLARIALARTYGKTVPFSGPSYRSMEVKEGKAVLSFDHVEGGLVAQELPETYVINSSARKTAPLAKPKPESQLQGFAICGADKAWKWADAKIEGDTVVAWSSAVPEPVAVRYAWNESPTCNLYNKAGLPASPFRTDDFPASSANAKY